MFQKSLFVIHTRRETLVIYFNQTDCSHRVVENICWCFQVLGDYNRQNKSLEEVHKFIKEIESISSKPLRDHFFNVSDEVALLTIVDALGSRIFALEGIPVNTHASPDDSFKE